MKKFFFTMIAALMCINCFAADYYYFEAWAEDDSIKSKHASSTNNLPLMVDLLDKTVNESRRFYRVYVDAAQFAAGWDALDQAVKDAGKSAAEDYSKDFEKWDTATQAAIDALFEEINVLRANAGLPEYNNGQIKQKLKDKKKDPKEKKPKKENE